MSCRCFIFNLCFQVNPCVFSEPTNSALSISFSVRDAMARGFYRWFSIVISSRDLALLVASWPFLNKATQFIITHIQDKAIQVCTVCKLCICKYYICIIIIYVQTHFILFTRIHFIWPQVMFGTIYLFKRWKVKRIFFLIIKYIFFLFTMYLSAYTSGDFLWISHKNMGLTI